MSAPHLRVFHHDSAPASSLASAILLSSYNSGVTDGGNRLGSPGYSYDFVAHQFVPLLQRLGKVIEVGNPRTGLSAAIQRARQEGLKPVHVSFRPFQDVHLTSSAPNVVAPAWEFPDIPNAAFDGNPQNNWVETANRCALVLAGGPFTAKALDAAGVKTLIRIVPVPTPETYFHLSRWQSDQTTTLDCSPYIFPETGAAVCTDELADGQPVTASQRRREAIRVLGLQTFRHLVKPCLPRRIGPVVAAALRAGMSAWQGQSLPRRHSQSLNLGGVVYASIFNPLDDRKNWEDMITAFLAALRDCEDATLVMKLVTCDPLAVHAVLSFYRRLDVSHRCRLVLIPDFLTEASMLQLVRATTFYLTTTRAEGNCLPLMNCLAAGRPCVSPSHTAIGDYFDSEVGFVVESHPEPCNWPQDSRKRWRTTRHRLVWPSLVEQIRQSYRIAKQDQAAYAALADAAQERMLRWSHPDAVWPRLRSAMGLLAPLAEPAPESAELRADATDQAAPRIIPIGTGVRRRSQRLASVGASGPFANATPMRVVVSLLNFRPGKIGGTETYLRQLIARLSGVNRQHQIVLLMDRDLAAENLFPGIERTVVDLSARQILRARVLEALSPYRAHVVEQTMERLQPDVVFFPQQSIFPKNVAAPCVLVVHDLYHLLLPQYLSRWQRLFRQRSYAYAVSRADRIIAISQFTKNSIVEQYRVAPELVSVIPHGWEASDAGPVEADPELSGKYLYYPAITRPHKNHHVLLESIAALRSQGRFDSQLILSGIQTPHWKTLRKQIHRLKLDETVRHEGYVSYGRVRQLYHGAECVVFPTSFEGFGLPVVEAFEAGKKIVVSRLEVFDEIGVPERFQIDFADPEQLYRALQEPGVTVLEKRPWTWDESAAATIGLLGSAAGRESPARVLARAA
jgi:glycosyltransferase involved in cell wall biosynthesis